MLLVIYFITGVGHILLA